MAGPLTSYLQDVRRLLGDQGVVSFDEEDLTTYINEARLQLATETGCVRQLVIVNLVPLQEIYNFTDVTLPATVQAIQSVRSVSVHWSAIRYTCRWMGFSRYQAQVRNYVDGYNSNPTVAAQYGQGQSGSIYFYPVPDSAYVTEWDSVCSPSPLASDADIELIPNLFTQAVKYYAAFRALDQIQPGEELEKAKFRQQSADRQFANYAKFVKRARAFAQPGQVSNWYGRR